jgi:hypothetical protein
MSGTLRLRGATSGYSELQAPAVAADQTFVLPTAGGTLLTTDSPVPQLTLQLGSASEPSLRFQGDTDTGLFSEGTNTLNLVTGGSSKVVLGADAHTIYSGTGASVRAVDIDSSGRILIGGTSSVATSNVNNALQIQGTNQANARISIQRVSADTSGPGIHLAKARSSNFGIVQEDDQVGIIAFNPADGTNYGGQCANIQCYIDGTPGVNDIPGRLSFQTSADGSAGPTERLRITSDGQIIINEGSIDSGPTETLIVNGYGNNSNIVKVYGASNTSAPFAGLGVSNDGSAALFTAGNNGGANSCDMALRTANNNGAETTRLFIAGHDTFANFFTADTANHTGNINNLQITGGTTNRPRLSLMTNDTSITDGNELGRINWWNNDGGWNELAYMRVIADQDFSTGNKGSRITWGTTADGATTPTDHMILSSSGHLTVNKVLNVREAIDLADNDVLRFGSGDDAQMVHDGANLYLKLLADDDLIITDENNSLNAFRFDTSARRLYVQDNINAGYNLSDYNSGVGNSITTYARDSANQTDTWTAYTQIAADWRGKLNETTNESTHLLISRIKDRSGNDATMAKIDVGGSIWGLGSMHAGRTQSSTTGTATNYYWRGSNGYGFHGYNGTPVTDKLYSTSARCIVSFRAQFDDADDRKAIYMVKSDTDAAYDYDADQYLACSAMGRFDVKGGIRSGRVESDETNPNSIYAPVGWGGGNGVFSYVSNANSYTAIAGRTTSNTDYVFRVRVNQTSDKVRIQADGQAYTDGAWNNSPADYAEYFEWADGNSNNEDRRGLPVVLDANGKIRVATNQDNTDNIIGVISAHPAFVGDAAELSWHGTYEKDEFGQPLTEDEAWLIWNKEYQDGVPINQPVADNPDTWGTCEGFPLSQLEDIKAKMAAGVDTGIPQWAIDQNVIVNKPKQIVSSSYDSTQVYIPRSKRKEWDTVGLIGKLPVVKGSPVGSRWIKMNEINNELDKYFVR